MMLKHDSNKSSLVQLGCKRPITGTGMPSFHPQLSKLSAAIGCPDLQVGCGQTGGHI